MPDFDSNYVMAIIAFAAVITPSITTFQNNRFQLKLKKLENKQKIFEKTILYQTEIFENYISAVGKSLAIDSIEVRKELGHFHAIAYLYAPENLKPKLSTLYTQLKNRNTSTATDLFEEIVPLINSYLSSLDKE